MVLKTIRILFSTFEFMKYTYVFLIVLSLFSCDSSTYNLKHKPNDFEILKYKMTLESDQTELKQTTKFTITKKGENQFGVETLIKKLKLYYIEGNVKRVQHIYDDYVNQPMYFEMDTIGNIKEGVDYNYMYDPKEVFDVTNYFIKFPNKPIQIGDSWEAKVGSLAYDYNVIFKTYTLTGVDQNMIFIDEECEYSSGLDGGFYGSTKTSSGNYTVDRKTGNLIKAYITLYVSIGRETSVGQISISKY